MQDPKKIIVFGATGTVGRRIVDRALLQGHQVTAFTRNAGAVPLDHPDLSIVAGDVLNAASVRSTIAGHDAVIVALGAGRKGGVRAVGTRHIVDGMKAQGVRRLIVQSTLGAGDSRPALNFFWKRIMFGLLLRPAYADHQRQEDIVTASGLDWTLVRPSAFTDGPATNKYQHGFAPTIKGLALKISRADVAGFMLRQLTDQTYLGRAANLSC